MGTVPNVWSAAELGNTAHYQVGRAPARGAAAVRLPTTDGQAGGSGMFCAVHAALGGAVERVAGEWAAVQGMTSLWGLGRWRGIT